MQIEGQRFCEREGTSDMVHKFSVQKVPKGWILDTERDYIAFSEGNYYADNNAIVFRIPKKEVVLRNTYTGEEKVLARNVSKQKALTMMRKFAKSDFERI
jgi:hypothetical protein